MFIRWIAWTWLAFVSVSLEAAAADNPKTEKASVDWVVSVILPEAKPVDPARLAAAVRKWIPQKEVFTGVEADKGVVMLRVAGGTALVSLMEAPIPGQELQRTCHNSWYWREACDAIKDHKAHLLVVLTGTKLSKVDSAVVQTKIVAALIEESNAVAAYWGTSLNSRESFLEQSTKIARDRMPTWLWVSYRVSRDASGRFSLSTEGLKDFKLMEIEAKDVTKPFNELYSLVEGMAAYLIAKGPVIHDGHTVGPTNEQRIRVRHAPSYWRKGTRVYRLEF
jgi:Domain of unknown function (DUF4261)